MLILKLDLAISLRIKQVRLIIKELLIKKNDDKLVKIN